MQSKYKLLSKVPDFKSQFLVNKDQSSANDANSATDQQHPESGINIKNAQSYQAPPQNRFSQLLNSGASNAPNLGRTTEIHRMSSPIRRNRPRITNEVQSTDKDIAQYL